MGSPSLTLRTFVPGAKAALVIVLLIVLLMDSAVLDPGSGQNKRMAVISVVSTSKPAIVTGTGTAARPGAVSAPRSRDRRDPWLRIEPSAPGAFPPAGQPGHGSTAVLRRQPARIVDGRSEGGYTGVFELICPSCGDHPYLDYSEVPPRLQRLRGPRALEHGLAAYHEHLGLAWPGRHQHIEINDNERTVAAAEVTSDGPGGTAWASLSAESGHIAPGRRASLVDALLDLPEVQESSHLSVVFPLGDGETLQRLQERCPDIRTHPAGHSALIETNLPSRGAAAH